MDAYNPPMISSSPLKTATSVPSVSGALSAYLHKYCEVATGGRVVLQSHYSFSSGYTGWLRFKCNTCKNNWNMKTDLFSNQTSCPKELQDWLVQHKHVCQDFKPQTLSPQGLKCFSCGWSWDQHKSGQPQFDIENNVWVNPAPPQQSPHGPQVTPGPSGESVIYHKMMNGDIISINPATGQTTFPYQGRTTGVRPCVVCEELIPVATGSSVCDECYKAAKSVRETKKLTITKIEGRMFRQKESDRCESQKDTKPTNSLDSAN